MGRKSKEHSRNAKNKSSSERKKKIKSIPQTQENVRVKDVQIIDKRRELDPKKVEALAASILMVGLRTPITVKRLEEECDGVSITVLAFVAGGYRLEAFKSLQRSRIPAFVIEGDQNDARILQLTENLYRTDLTALQHAEDLAALVELVQTDKGGQVAHPGGKQPHDRGINRAAKKLGFSPRKVRRSINIANITVEAKAKAIEVGFDKKQSRLLVIAKEEGVEAQLAKIAEMTKARASGFKASPSSRTKANKKTSSNEAAEASEQDNDSPAIVPEPGHPDWEQEDSDSEQQESDDLADVDHSEDDDSEEEGRLFSSLKAAWDTAPQSVRKRFVKEVLLLDLDQVGDEIWTPPSCSLTYGD